jgi:hypothetical protein
MEPNDGAVTNHFECDGSGAMCGVCGESEPCCTCEEPELEPCAGCDGAGQLIWWHGEWIAPSEYSRRGGQWSKR